MGKIIKPGDLFLYTEKYMEVVQRGSVCVGAVRVVAKGTIWVGDLKSDYNNIVIWLNDCKLTRLIYDVQISKRG